MTVSPASSESLETWHFEPDAEHGFRLWNVLILAAGLILALSFFLPVLNAPYGEPVNLIRSSYYLWFADAGMPGNDFFFAFCNFFACHLFGGLMAAAGAACLAGRRHLAGVVSMVLATLLVLIGAGLLWTAPVTHGEAFRIGDEWSLWSALIAGVSALAYVIWATRLGPQAFPYYGFAACVAALSYFGFLWWSGSALYGTYVALTASALLLVGTVAIARRLPRQSWWGTLSRLVMCQTEGTTAAQQAQLATAGRTPSASLPG